MRTRSSTYSIGQAAFLCFFGARGGGVLLTTLCCLELWFSALRIEDLCFAKSHKPKHRSGYAVNNPLILSNWRTQDLGVLHRSGYLVGVLSIRTLLDRFYTRDDLQTATTRPHVQGSLYMPLHTAQAIFGMGSACGKRTPVYAGGILEGTCEGYEGDAWMET